MSVDPIVTLESPLPASLPVGRGTAVLCYGVCAHPSERVVGLELFVGGDRHPPAAMGMPRPDVAQAAGRLDSGFWGTVPIPSHDRPGVVELGAEVRLTGGAVSRVPLGRIAVVSPDAPAGRAARTGLIAVCMATYEPDLALLAVQVQSLRAQTDTDWTCVVSDDHSTPERFAEVEAMLEGDTRFVISRSERRLGFYRNFERALRMAPAQAGLVALCDQDDRWWPEKLEVLRGALGGAAMVYSDQRLVDADGRLLRPTMWRGRRNNHSDLASLLVANSITGAALLMRRDVADLALPFPDTPGLQFHDHWLGLVGLAAGEVAYVDRPLYDYVQHAGAVFGEVSADRRRLRAPRSPLRGGRGAYFLGYLAREVAAQALLVRCAGRLTDGKRRALRRYVAADRSALALVWLAWRGLRPLVGRDETLGGELELVRGLLWRRLVGHGGRRPWADASFPDVLAFEQRKLRRWRAGA